MRTWLGCVGGLVLACTPRASSVEDVEEKAETAAQLSAPSESSDLETTAAAPVPARRCTVEPPAATFRSIPWEWWHVASGTPGSTWLRVGAGAIATQPLRHDPYRFVVARTNSGIELRREDLESISSDEVLARAWSVERSVEAIADPVVLTGFDLVAVVGVRVEGGYYLAAWRPDGERFFERTFRDPCDTGGYELQLAPGPQGRVLARNRGEGVAYVDEVDLLVGKALVRASFDTGTLLHEQFHWPKDAPGSKGLWDSWTLPSGRYRLQRVDDRVVLVARDAHGAERWRTQLQIEPRWSNLASMREHDGAVVLVVLSGSASGSFASIVDAKDGRLRWQGGPGSIGSIGHSMYRNRVRITTAGPGRVRVHGRESGGSYVGVLDLDLGLWGHEVWR